MTSALHKPKLFAAAATVLAALAVAVVATAATYTNNTAVNVPDATLTIPPTAGEATSTISVSESSAITSVQVVLLGIEHDNAEDFDIQVMSPAGTRVVLMSDAGKNPDETPADAPARVKPPSSINPGTNLTFSDSGATLPEFGAISTGTYKPADYGASSDPFCSGESDAQTPYTTTLSSFNGQNPSGTWTLIARDDCGGFAGRLAGGWCIIVNSSSGPCQAPTSASIRSLASRRVAAGIAVTWRTATESEIAGFNVFRVAGGKSAKANHALIAAKRAGTARGASYRFVDRGVHHARYRLQVVRLDGSRSWAGFARS